MFDALGGEVLPQLDRAASAEDRPVRCWCAGCASGEEVYTLKILWDLKVQADTPQTGLEVIGTDADEAVLRRADRGCFPLSSLRGVPDHWRALAFDRRDRCYRVRAEHRGGITFALQDIRHERPAGPFDLILCRNLVFTYFEPALQQSMLDRIGSALRDGGYLAISARERLPRDQDVFEQVDGSREIHRKALKA